ncbi:hypothetical protein GALL_535750 [mine drainage metagenome]|uniref:Uncharacterized protein n=1 Tax=mine drainage metagenome TaxID=410659 RepID=A0A1J5P003_9ZZZZ
MIDAGCGLALCCAKGGEERHEVIFLAVADARVGRRFPIQQIRRALGRSLGQGPVQPCVERGRRNLGLWAKHAQVVIAKAGADDQHTVVPQGGKRAAKREMRGGIVAGLQRHLEQRHVSLGIHHIGGHEGAVVIALRGIQPGWQTGSGDQIGGAARDVRGAGGWIDDLVSLGREAAIIVDHTRLGRGHHRKF